MEDTLEDLFRFKNFWTHLDNVEDSSSTPATIPPRPEGPEGPEM